MTQIHKLARAHYHAIDSNNLVLEHPQHFPGEPKEFLNTNINNFRDSPYRYYPDTTSFALHHQYLETLKQVSCGVDLSHLGTQNLMFTTGSLGGIEAVLRAFCEPGKDAFLLTNPTFMYYAYWAKVENLNVIDKPLRGENLDRLDVAGILACDAKVLFLCCPINPVGGALDPDDVAEVLDNFKGIVVMDEAYIEWSELPTYARLIDQYENLMITRTMSKAWGLAGTRVGIVLASEALISTLMIPATRFRLSTPVEALIMEALKQPAQLLDFRARSKANGARLLTCLQACPYIEKVYPSVAPYFLFKSKRAHQLANFLDARHLRILDMTRGMPNHARISVGNEAQTDRLIQALEAFAGHPS